MYLDTDHIEFATELYRQGMGLRYIKAEIFKHYKLKTSIMTIATSLKKTGVKMRGGKPGRHNPVRMKLFSVYMPPGHYEQLKRLGNGKFSSTSEYIRYLVRQEIERHESAATLQ